MAFNDDIAGEVVEQRLGIMRLEAGIRQVVLGVLYRLRAELEEELRAADVAGVARLDHRRLRAEKLVGKIRSLVSGSYVELRGSLTRELRDLASFVGEDFKDRFEALLQGEFKLHLPSASELRAMADETILGGTAKEWWGQQAEQTRLNFAREVRTGVALGETTPEITARVLGKRTGQFTSVVVEEELVRVPVYAQGILEGSVRNARTLVRTAVQNVSNQALWKTYQENADVLRGVQAQVTLDGRTSDICISRSGASWDVETGKPLPESPRQEPFPGPPPWHFNCRTILVPVTKSWEALSAGRLKPGLSTVPDSVQASMDGEVAGDLTFERWLGSKSPEFGRRVLGSSRYGLWQEGKIGLAQLVDQSGRPLTLQQLRALRGPSRTAPR